MSKNDPSGTPAQSREEALAKLKRSLTDELDRIFDEDLIKAAQEARGKPKPAKEEPRIEVTNYGRLANILMPPGWIETKPEPDEQNPKRKLRVFHPPESPEVKMCLYFRGSKVSDAAAQSFQAVLSKSAHFVTPAELKQLEEVLRDKSDKERFKMIVVATRDVSGMKVLICEGRFLDTKEDVYAIFVDADGSGGIVQEVFFEGPKDEYLSYFSEALSAVKSIQWKSV